jgi:hypothetical protein
LNHGPGCDRDPDRRPVWLTVAPQQVTLAGQAGPGPLLAAVTAALREIIHCSKTRVAMLAEAEGPGHIQFHVVLRGAVRFRRVLPRAA